MGSRFSLALRQATVGPTALAIRPGGDQTPRPSQPRGPERIARPVARLPGPAPPGQRRAGGSGGDTQHTATLPHRGGGREGTGYKVVEGEGGEDQ